MINQNSDTTFIKSPSFDTMDLAVIDSFYVQLDQTKTKIIVLTNEEQNPMPPPDGGIHYYMTPELGIFYSHNVFDENESQLHSNNKNTNRQIRLWVKFVKNKVGR